MPSVELAGLGWSIESTRRDRPRTSERRMNSYNFSGSVEKYCLEEGISETSKTHLPNVTTNLTCLSQEFYASHPFIEAQSRFTSKIMEMSDQPFEHILHACIFAQRIGENDIFGDIFDREVSERWNVERRRVHF